MAYPAPGKAELDKAGWIVPAHFSPEAKITGRCATLVVAASDSLHPEQADYVCDGTDDQVEIQAAIDASPRGGLTLLLEGTYSIGASISIVKQITLAGVGHSWTEGGTQLKLANNAECDVINIEGTTEHLFFVKIRDLCIHGNKTNQVTGGRGISAIDGTFGISDSMIQNVAITQCKSDGIYINGGWLHIIQNVWTEYNDGSGFYVYSTRISDSHSSWNGKYGLRCGDTVRAVNSNFNQNDENGVMIWTTSTIELIGCSISTNGKDLDVTRAGIRFGSTAHDNVVVGCTIDGNSETPYGMKFDSASYNNICIGNNVRESVTANVLVDAGGNSGGKIQNNVGHITENSGTATLANGTTSIAVTHGLAVTPAAGDIVVTPIEAWGNMTQFYIDSYTSTQFTIHADINPGQDVDFAWKAIIL